MSKFIKGITRRRERKHSDKTPEFDLKKFAEQNGIDTTMSPLSSAMGSPNKLDPTALRRSRFTMYKNPTDKEGEGKKYTRKLKTDTRKSKTNKTQGGKKSRTSKKRSSRKRA
jgi:hypothetical protein